MQAGSQRLNLSEHQRGQTIFAEGTTFEDVQAWLDRNAEVRTTTITEEFSFQQFKEQQSEFLPMFIVSVPPVFL